MIPNAVSNEDEKELFSSDSYLLRTRRGKLWLMYYHDHETKYNYRERLSELISKVTDLGYHVNQPFVLDAIVNFKDLFDDGEGDCICHNLEDCVSMILLINDDESDAHDFVQQSTSVKLDI